MSFIDRNKVSSKFEKALFQQIERIGFSVAVNGTEHTHPEFVCRLKSSTDQTSMAIRYQPDAVASIGKIPRTFYLEAKAAKTIERNAWVQYQKLASVGNIVVIVFEKISWSWNFIENIKLIDGYETVSSFDPDDRFPIVDGWIVPRGSSRWRQLLGSVAHASFTPYREVDRRSLLSWRLFRREIISRLGRG